MVTQAVQRDLKQNRYDPATAELVLSPSQVVAWSELTRFWAEYITRDNSAPGLPAKYIDNPDELRLLGTYFDWATWAAVTNRPGLDYTYTNNWPYDPEAGNTPSTQAYVWSALSLVALLAGLGLILLAFGKYHFLGWEGAPDELPS